MLSLLQLQAHEHACTCALHADLALIPILKASPRTAVEAISVSIARTLSSRFKKEARKAIEDALKLLDRPGTFSRADAEAVMDALDKSLGPAFATAIAAELSEAIKGAYMAAKTGTGRDLRISPSFGLVDRKALEWMDKSYPWWVGSYQTTTLAREISAIVREAVLTQGLERRAAAEVLRSQLERIYGLGKGAPSPITVPGRYSGNSDTYWGGLSNHVATTARMFAHLTSLQQAEISKYTIHAVNDERTCQLCSFLDGMTFNVAEGVAYRDEILKTTTPEEYKKVAGWMRYKQAKDIFNKGGKGALAETSARLPPFHFLCRCWIEAE